MDPKQTTSVAFKGSIANDARPYGVIFWDSPNFEVVRSKAGAFHVSAKSSGSRSPGPASWLDEETGRAVAAVLTQPRQGSVPDRDFERDQALTEVLGYNADLMPCPPLRLNILFFMEVERRKPKPEEIRRWQVSVGGMTADGLQSHPYVVECRADELMVAAASRAEADGVEANNVYVEAWSPIIKSSSRWLKAVQEAAKAEDFETALRVAEQSFQGLPFDVTIQGTKVDMSRLDLYGLRGPLAAEVQQALCDLADRFGMTLHVSRPIGEMAHNIGSGEWFSRFGFIRGMNGRMFREPLQPSGFNLDPDDDPGGLTP